MIYRFIIFISLISLRKALSFFGILVLSTGIGVVLLIGNGETEQTPPSHSRSFAAYSSISPFATEVPSTSRILDRVPASAIFGSAGGSAENFLSLEEIKGPDRRSALEIALAVELSTESGHRLISSNLGGLKITRVLQIEDPILLIDDGQFVWGPNLGNFDVGAYLKNKNSGSSGLRARDRFVGKIFTSINPKILIAFLELEHGFLTNIPSDMSPEDVKSIIETTSMELATAFYEHLYTWGSRKNQGNLRAQGP